MKAIVNTVYGSPDVLRLQEVEKPVPKDDQVLVKILAASVNPLDWHLMRADPFLVRLGFGFLKPKLKILGADVAGRIEAVGSKVQQLKPGDEVFGDLFPSGLGGFAEYACGSEETLVLKPANLSFEEAAAVPIGALTALQALRDHGHLQPGQKVLINGASGGVGTFAVQIAKAFGAEVTGVCGPGNLEMVRSIGADHVIDYTKEDFAKNGQGYDLILAANGNRSIWDYRRALSPRGTYVMSGGAGAQMAQAIFLGPWVSMTGPKKMGYMSAKGNQKDLLVLKEMIEAGKIRPVIDRRYPLSEVPQAIRYLEEGHAKGKVIIKVEPV